jgi:hypothetical protein
MKHRIATAICATLLFGVIGFVVYFMFNNCEGTYYIDTIQLSHDNFIEIRAEKSWEISQGLEYRISGSNISSSFGRTTESPDDLKLLAIEAESGNLVAIVEAANPDVVLILHDYQSGSSWPYRHKTENLRACLKRGEEMLKRLKSQNSMQNYVLSYHVPGNRKLKISA